ncbi:TylF/MycF/NovP-related O-methyltransferase [Methylomonas koyamae]|uniref:TylF/MycF/NovP-related O-methyltransferase n=1 Tax=Methylomonas koyamae TaxID=702114 RepID=UPI001126EEB4|nr:TylF/MycF/NovP-related O-methyltransferase [Methylomonas koyamae]TPQ25227.1 dTDP-6-deoxy-L-hexose 3-O-methyltransferase [Methylomonas koyamae]
MKPLIEKYPAPINSKLDNFEKYVRRQALSRFLVRYELFQMQLHIKGSIIECGVHHGGGLMAWAKLSAALEPFALDRRIFGFDTFEGFPSVNDKDIGLATNEQTKVGGLSTSYDVYAELQELIGEFDENRVLNQFEKVFLVKGNAMQTIPTFLEQNPHVLISLLFLDFDLYDPTKVALQYFLPRMPKGSILAFDEINNPWWPGETMAMLEFLDIGQKEIRRFSFDPNIAYIVM